ncbi:unnamed protein product [Lota lota]
MVHKRGCFLEVLIIDVLLNGVKGEDMSEEETTDYRYALLGAGIGLFLAVSLLVVMLYMMGICKCPCKEAHMANGVYKMHSLTTPQLSHKTSSQRGTVCTTQHHSHLEEPGNKTDVGLHY